MEWIRPTRLRSRRAQSHILAAAFCLFILLVWQPANPRRVHTRSTSDQEIAGPLLPCSTIPGANETLVVLRTGATEIADRLPVHIKTTLQCFPNRLIFSDYEENFQGAHVIDVLDSVSLEIRQHHPDFELYRRLQRGGRAVLDPSELSGSDIQVANNASGHPDNPGWKLDKWKFLPMMNRTLYERPDMTWYVFIEADTYIFWSTLLRYLASKDPLQPLYAGDEMVIDDDKFAHGGTGIVVSRPALQMVVDFYSSNKTEAEAATDRHWVGDGILGQVFRQAGVELTSLFPMFQGHHPGSVAYGVSEGDKVAEEDWQMWCEPTVSYHHVSPAEVSNSWRFEQRWLRNNDPSVDILRHKDVFKQYVMPQMIQPREDWDNLSDEDPFDDGDFANSFDDCRRRCQAKAECRQFSYNYGGGCKTRTNPMLGVKKEGVASGWILERVARWEQHMQSCGEETFELIEGG